MKVIADNSVCQANGLCALDDEELFTLDEDGYIAIGDGVDVPAGHEDSAKRGVDACPVAALRLE